jgi:hypothetical protein
LPNLYEHSWTAKALDGADSPLFYKPESLYGPGIHILFRKRMIEIFGDNQTIIIFAPRFGKQECGSLFVSHNVSRKRISFESNSEENFGVNVEGCIFAIRFKKTQFFQVK